MKKISILVLSLTLVFLMSCGKTANKGGDKEEFDTSKAINVLSREDGSGTRGAFIELFKIEEKDGDKKVDRTTQKAVITNSTSVMMTTVESDKYSIGYISLGSLNDKVKALKIDGVAASVKNVKDGSYKISRPFNILVKDDIDEASKDFISFIMSKDGQKIVEEAGYIPIEANKDYSGRAKGKVVVGGSSSVTPVMEKLKEEYTKRNPEVSVEVQQSDSTTGVMNTIDGTYNIGMASRNLKDTEEDKVKSMEIAKDGIAVIINNANTLEDVKSEMVKSIFIGDIATWDSVK